MPTAQGLAVTAWIAVFSSFLSQIFYLRGVDLIGPGRAGVFVNLVPVFAAVLAVGLISEPFAPYHAVALVLVLGGIWLAQRAAGMPEAARHKSPPNGP
jgi:drug/metabolite transporter (DMT)-like permease